MKPTISRQIIETLKKEKRWFQKQELCDRVRFKYRTTHDATGRIARMMAEENLIKVQYVEVPRVRAMACYRV